MLKIQTRFNALSKKFFKDTRGAVAIIFGITIIPILMAVGLAVDYSVTSDNKSKLDSAADAAALAGAIRAKTYLAENQGRGLPDSVVIAQAKVIAKKEAEKHFDGSLTKLVNTSNVTRNIEIEIDTQNRTVNANVKYGADVALSVAPVVNINNFHVTNGSEGIQAQANLPTYLDIYVVMDNSGSMGIGADDSNIAKIKDLNTANPGCEVACHTNGYPSYNQLKSLTGANKVTMRIDVLRDAITGMLSQANAIKTTNDLFQFTLLAFSNDLVPLQSASTDYAQLNTGIASLDLDNRNGGTNFHYSIGTQLPGLVPSSQDGSSALKRKTHIVIITDGVENNRFQTTFGSGIGDPNFTDWLSSTTQYVTPSTGDHIQAFNPRICDAVKAKGAQVTVLNVKYIVPKNPSGAADEFDHIGNNIIGQEATTLAGCASNSSDYYSANTPAEIKSAVAAIFGNILRPVRLTN